MHPPVMHPPVREGEATRQPGNPATRQPGNPATRQPGVLGAGRACQGPRAGDSGTREWSANGIRQRLPVQRSRTSRRSRGLAPAPAHPAYGKSLKGRKGANPCRRSRPTPPSKSCLPQSSPAARSFPCMAVPVLARCCRAKCHSRQCRASSRTAHKKKFTSTRSRRRVLLHVGNMGRAGSRSSSVAITPPCPRVTDGDVPCRFVVLGGNTLPISAPLSCRFLLSFTF